MTTEHVERAGRSGRWVRRESRRQHQRDRLKKHGASLRRVYLDAVRKRAEQRSAATKP